MLPMATVSLVAMETHETMSSERCELEDADRQDQENETTAAEKDETMTPDTRHDLCHRHSVVKECRVGSVESTINEQHQCSSDDDDDDDNDDEDDDNDEDADIEDGYEDVNVNEDVNDNEDTALGSDVFCDNDDYEQNDVDDEDEDEDKDEKNDSLFDAEKDLDKEESTEKMEEKEKEEQLEMEEEREDSKVDGDLDVLGLCDISDVASRVPSDIHSDSEKLVEVCGDVLVDFVAGKVEGAEKVEHDLVAKKEVMAKNHSGVNKEDKTAVLKSDKSLVDRHDNRKTSNIPDSSEEKDFGDKDKNEVVVVNKCSKEIYKNKCDDVSSHSSSSVNKTEDHVKTSVCVVKSKEQVHRDSVKLGLLKETDSIPLTDIKLGARKSSAAQRSEASAERTDTCSKPKCILMPRPVDTSEVQPKLASDTASSQPGGGSTAHRVLQRQKLPMAPPPPSMSSHTHIPRLHRHCVMSYDGGRTGGGGVCQSTLPPMSTARTSSSRASPLRSSRRESVEEDDLGQQQYVVNVHVNPGETFSVCVSDQVQLIQGPATVRMVSNNGPPLPMPMQVPPGHMVQQIIDENGILTNVILSSQPPGIPAPPMMVGYYGSPSGTPPYVYSPYGPPYPPYPSPYPMHHHPHPTPHMHHMPAPPRMHGSSPPHHCNSHGHPPPHLPAGHAPPPPPAPPQQTAFHLNHSTAMADDRLCSGKGGRPQQRNYKTKMQHRDRHCISSSSSSSLQQTAATQTRTQTGRANGVALRVEPHSESWSSDDPELEEEQRVVIQEILSKMPLPKVLDMEARSALIVLTPPEVNQKDCDLESTEFQYELHLSEKKDSGFNLVYSGDATEITLRDLKPATEYHLKVHSILNDIKSLQPENVQFRTHSCEPETPQPPKLVSKTTTSLSLKWSSVAENGSKITSYILESDQGHSDPSSSFITFVEIFNDLHRAFRVTKLSPSSRYTFRLAAVNAKGKSDYSDVICYCTSGTAPSQPDPPMLSEQFVSSLTISWIRRPKDDVFSLQMEDEAVGRGFVTLYTGFNLSFTVQHLHRNTEYRFRLQASNEDGSSPWSDVVKYRTLPDKPQSPPRPQVKGKVHSRSFRVIWDSPKDSGGNEITFYVLQIDSGNGFETVYSGLIRDYSADQLVPGHTYWLRVACVSSIGQSEWSDVLSVITQIVPPGQCTGLRLHGKPQATTIHIKWAMPDFTGGAPFSDYEVLMTNPENSACEVYRGPDMECSVTGLLPGRIYLFQVRCLNRAGAGPWSESLEVVSGASVPDPPPQPTIICKSPHSAHISWGEPTGNGASVTEYRLEWQQRDTEFSQLFCGLSITAEVNGLLPATMYSFRVQAVNSAGAGPFSAIASCVTPPSNPGQVTSVRASSTATSIHVTWKEPCDNGAKVISYNVGIDDGTLIAVGNLLEYSIDDLLPETSYRVRVQAVNAVGLGAFSYPVKVMTRSLPPHPPVIECIAAGYNSLKLKWKDSRYQPDLFQYCLEMLRVDGSFHPVYQGSGHSHKVYKLNELTQYEFRIYSSNAAGDGPCSEVFKFSTLKAPPGIVKALHVSSLAIDSGVADWLPLKPMGTDDIVYVLQLQASSGRDQSFREVYRGAETSFRLAGLSSGSEYRVRVCAVRQTKDGAGALVGPFSQTFSFFTESQKPASIGTMLGTIPTKSAEQRKLSDQQWAVVLLGCFTIFAIFLAFLANLIISQATGAAGSDAIEDPSEGRAAIDAPK